MKVRHPQMDSYQRKKMIWNYLTNKEGDQTFWPPCLMWVIYLFGAWKVYRFDRHFEKIDPKNGQRNDWTND